jgi:hypothetical protein
LQAILDLFHGSLNPFPQGITSVFDFNHVALPPLAGYHGVDFAPRKVIHRHIWMTENHEPSPRWPRLLGFGTNFRPHRSRPTPQNVGLREFLRSVFKGFLGLSQSQILPRAIFLRTQKRILLGAFSAFGHPTRRRLKVAQP